MALFGNFRAKKWRPYWIFGSKPNLWNATQERCIPNFKYLPCLLFSWMFLLWIFRQITNKDISTQARNYIFHVDCCTFYMGSTISWNKLHLFGPPKFPVPPCGLKTYDVTLFTCPLKFYCLAIMIGIFGAIHKGRPQNLTPSPCVCIFWLFTLGRPPPPFGADELYG